MYDPTLETGGQTRCTKTEADGDVFCARSVTSHVSEMLTSHRLGSTASQHVSSRRVSIWPTTSVLSGQQRT